MENGTTTHIVLKELAGNPPPQLNTIQSFLTPHIDTLIDLWTAVWLTTVLVLLAKLLHEYKKYKKEKGA